MIVAYKKSIIEKITDACNEAKKLNKIIEYITLTKDEASELYDSYNTKYISHISPNNDDYKILVVHNSIWCNVLIKVEGLN